MKIIKLRHQRLQAALSNLIDRFWQPDNLKALCKFAEEHDTAKDNMYGGFHPVTDEYLKDALTKPAEAYGFPRLAYAIPFNSTDRLTPPPDKDPVFQFPELGPFLLQTCDVFRRVVGAQERALAAFYPPGGYLAWHHNGNAPGYNILLSYSQNGGGTFNFMKQDGTIVKYKDEPGWNAKAGYYGNIFENEPLFWHMTKTNEPRLTIALAMRNEMMWKNAVSLIEDTM